MAKIRWDATVVYRTDAGTNEVEYFLEELRDLHGLVEWGPHWDTVIEIRIVRHELTEGPLTVEEALKL